MCLENQIKGSELSEIKAVLLRRVSFKARLYHSEAGRGKFRPLSTSRTGTFIELFLPPFSYTAYEHVDMGRHTLRRPVGFFGFAFAFLLAMINQGTLRQGFNATLRQA